MTPSPEPNTQALEKALDLIRNLGTPEEMAGCAESAPPLPSPFKSNAHIHLPPNFSAFESVEQPVALAAEQGLSVLGASNYYDFSVYAEFAERCRAANIYPMFGLEIICLIDEMVRSGKKVNDPGNPGRFYFCGKGITRFAKMTPRARELMGNIRSSDTKRMAEMIGKIAILLNDKGLDIAFTEDGVIHMIVRRHGCSRESVTIQERHIAQALQQDLFKKYGPDERPQALTRLFDAEPKADSNNAVAVQNEIRSNLMKAGKPAFVEETFLNFEDSHELVLELGGIPSYPTLVDGANPICDFETPVENLIEEIKRHNIHAAEYIPIRNEPEMLASYVQAVRAAGIIVTAGTEHNTLDLIAMEPKCLRTQPVPEKIKDIFREGACVVAAHQFLTLHGKCGYVDAKGDPNPEYATAEERITAFATFGEAVIQCYCS